MASSRTTESLRGLVLRHRLRTGLTQRELAARLDANRTTVQDWESGVKHPSQERLQVLIQVLFDSGGLTDGEEAAEARALWAAVLREAPRMQAPFDPDWFERLLGHPAASPSATAPAVPVERGQDWGEAPDVLGFVGRTEELATLRGWVVNERCRLIAVLGMGGIGKTALAAQLTCELAPGFHRLYWRGLRDARPIDEWLAGAIGHLSDQRLIAPEDESAQRATLLQLLRERPCLLVLDNFETVLEPGQPEGEYRAGFAGYGALLREIGQTSHQSCLVLTSRETPPELGVLDGDAVHTCQARQACRKSVDSSSES